MGDSSDQFPGEDQTEQTAQPPTSDLPAEKTAPCAVWPGMLEVDLERIVIPLATLALMPESVAQQNQMLVFLAEPSRIGVALAGPVDQALIHEIEQAAHRPVFLYRVNNGALPEVIEEAYRRRRLGEEHYIGAHVATQDVPPLRLLRDDQAGRITLLPSAPAPPSERSPAIEGDASGSEFATDRLSAISPAQAIVSDVPKEPVGDAVAQAKILIADPQDDFRQLIGRVLERKGFQVTEASTGNGVLALLERTPVDVVLIDSHLPGLHGFELCQAIRAKPRWSGLALVMVSAVYRGWRFAEDIKENFGVNDFLEKPFKASEVTASVQRVLQPADAAVDPEDAYTSDATEALLAMGVAAYQRGDLDAAVELLQSGVVEDPLCFKLHYHLGLLFGCRHQLMQAIDALETAVDIKPRSFSALKNLAILYQRAGFRRKSVEMWERALVNAPGVGIREGIREHLVQLF